MDERGSGRMPSTGHRFSAVIMTAPDRAKFLPELDEALGQVLPRVCDDDGLGVWGNGRRALMAHDPSRAFHLVLQDDTIPCRDLLAGLDELLRYVPPDNPVSLYMGGPQPWDPENRYAKMATEADEVGASFVLLDQIIWGPAVVVPTKHIEAIVRVGDNPGQRTSSYDGRIGRWCVKHRIGAWHSWPSLVSHRQDTPSLIGKKTGRDCIRFAGKQVSALHDLKWDGRIIDKDNAVTRGWREPYGKERAVEQIEKKVEVKRSPEAAWAIGDEPTVVRIVSGVEYDLQSDGTISRERRGQVESGELLGACDAPSHDAELLVGQVVVGKRLAISRAPGAKGFSGEVESVGKSAAPRSLVLDDEQWDGKHRPKRGQTFTVAEGVDPKSVLDLPEAADD